MMEQLNNEWIGVDLDGTLAYYHGFTGEYNIGDPIPEMLKRVKQVMADGKTVKIFTARAGDPSAIPYVKEWLIKHGIGGLEITNVKDFSMIELWDDRCIQVISNTGKIAAHESYKAGLKDGVTMTTIKYMEEKKEVK
jgi:hypothetical protein